MEISPADREALIRDKHHGDRGADLMDDIRRLAENEPLAYVIGWVPFLSTRIFLDSHPLIPRPETEWWTELLQKRIEEREKEGAGVASVLDLCAGSGAVGVAIAKACESVRVSFAELDPTHLPTIERNLAENGIASWRADVRESDVLRGFSGMKFDVIAANPPYIPSERELPASVREYEPASALFSGTDGLDLIRRIAKNVRHHLNRGGELWLECDTSNIDQAAALIEETGAAYVQVRSDLYGRPRLVVGYYA